MLVCFVLLALMSVIFKADEYILTKLCRSILTFGFGRMFQRYRLERILLKNWAALLAILAAFYAAFYHLTSVPAHVSDLYLKTVLKNLEIAFLGILGIAAVYIVSTFLAACKRRLTRLIRILGDYSLPIYLLHNPWIVHASNIVFKKLSVPDWAGNMVSILLGLLVPVVLHKYVIRKRNWLSRITLGIS